MEANHTLTDRKSPPLAFYAGTRIALIGLQVVMVPWMLATILTWSTDDMLEDNIPLYVLLGALLLAPVALLVVLRLAKINVVKKVLGNVLVYVALIVQIFLDYLLYAKFHKLFPFAPDAVIDGEPLQTGWMATDNEPILLFSIWAAWSLLVFLPSLVGSISRTPGLPGNALKSGFHVGFVVIGLAMGLQFGGPWSFPLQHLVAIAALLPFLYVTRGAGSGAPDTSGRPFYPVFSTIGLYFIIAFWSSTLIVQAGAAPVMLVPWACFCLANLALALAGWKRPGWEVSPGGKKLVVLAWLILIGATACVIMVNLIGFFAEALVLWLSLGIVGISVFPEMLSWKEQFGRKIVGSRLLFAMYLFILGIIMAYLPNIYDPISSYAAFVIIGIPVLFSLFVFTPRREWGRNVKK